MFFSHFYFVVCKCFQFGPDFLGTKRHSDARGPVFAMARLVHLSTPHRQVGPFQLKTGWLVSWLVGWLVVGCIEV